jgi:hypothetical protein
MSQRYSFSSLGYKALEDNGIIKSRVKLYILFNIQNLPLIYDWPVKVHHHC